MKKYSNIWQKCQFHTMLDPKGGVHLTKCYCNLQSNMRGFICHAISLHPLSIPHVYMKIYRVIRGECKCYMACNSYKIHDVEKWFWGDTEVYILQKMIFGP